MTAWTDRMGRPLVATFVMALLLTSVGGQEAATLGADLGDRISVARSSQRYYESRMRALDRVVARVDHQRKAVRKQVKHSNKAIVRSTRQLKKARQRLHVAQELLDRAEARFDGSPDAPDPDSWHDKMVKLNRDVRLAQERRDQLSQKVKSAKARNHGRTRKLQQLKRQRDGVAAKRANAEGALGAYIVRMTALAQQRAAVQSDVRLSSSSDAFAWPSDGVVTQGFGCTGFRLNPPRGSCRHFHDGVDLVSGYGSPIGAAAVGVVAYVGWNPWDEGERAFIVVVGHPGGYVTRYGHLIPNRRIRVGQLVHKGQAIGRMGSTGNSTGTHLHFELLQGAAPLDPTAYLPGGVVNVRGARKSAHADGKHHARQAQHKKHAKHRNAVRQARHRKHQAARQARRSPAERADSTSSTLTGPDATACATQADVLESLGISAAEATFLDIATDGLARDGGDGTTCAPADDSPTRIVAPQRPSGGPVPLAVTGGSAAPGPPADRRPLRGTSPLPQ